MSITLNDLLEWRDRLPDASGEEAHMVNALIARREADLRSRIADSIAMASQRENWKLQRCAAIARRVEQASVAQLELVHTFFHNRSEGRLDIETPAVLSEFFAQERAPVQAPVTVMAAAAPPSPVAHLHGAMGRLESSIATTPGVACGIQGIRIMRMVALMSKARSAQIAKMRMTGAQAYYRHS